jgi:hypothetical protein
VKLTGSMTEEGYRAELVKSRSSLFTDDDKKGLLSCLRARYPSMRTACIINWTPEQSEDVYRILIDTSVVIVVESDRQDRDHPRITREISLQEYQSALSKTARIKLSVALDLARREMTACGDTDAADTT